MKNSIVYKVIRFKTNELSIKDNLNMFIYKNEIMFSSYNVDIKDIERNDIQYKISFEDIRDIYFTSKIQNNIVRNVIKFLLNKNDYVYLDLEIDSYKNFKNNLNHVLLIKKPIIKLNLNGYNKFKLNLLLNNKELQIVYEEIVLNKKIINNNNFFEIISPNMYKKYINKEYKEIDYKGYNYEIEKIIPTINSKNYNLNYNKNKILFKKEDKEYLLNKFSEIKLNLTKKLKDSDNIVETEKEFWEDFFKEQKIQNTFLYGNSLDEKILRVNLPNFLKEKLKNLKIKNNFEKIVEDSLIMSDYIKYKSTNEFSDSIDLINKINNINFSNLCIDNNENNNRFFNIDLKHSRRNSRKSISFNEEFFDEIKPLNRNNSRKVSISKTPPEINKIKNTLINEKSKILKKFDNNYSFKNIYNKNITELIRSSKKEIAKLNEMNKIYQNTEDSENINFGQKNELLSNNKKYNYFSILYYNVSKENKPLLAKILHNFVTSLNDNIISKLGDKKTIVKLNYNYIVQRYRKIFKELKNN